MRTSTQPSTITVAEPSKALIKNVGWNTVRSVTSGHLYVFICPTYVLQVEKQLPNIEIVFVRSFEARERAVAIVASYIQKT